MRRTAILISGAGSNMAALVRAMTGDHPCRPVLVASDVPSAPGLDLAARLGVPVAAVDRSAYPDRAAFEGALLATLDAARPDLVCLAGFMRILSPHVVDAYADRMLNIHPSLLPAHPGLDTHARALAAGDAQAGCTVHAVTRALDGGPILGRAVVAVRAGDTPATLGARVLEAEHRLYPDVLRRVAEGRRDVLDL